MSAPCKPRLLLGGETRRLQCRAKAVAIQGGILRTKKLVAIHIQQQLAVTTDGGSVGQLIQLHAGGLKHMAWADDEYADVARGSKTARGDH